MNRTTIMLPPRLKAQAQQEAHERGISLGELIRQAIEESLRSGRTTRREADPLFVDAAVFSGEAPEDLAAQHDQYLYGE